jgi:PIN domain
VTATIASKLLLIDSSGWLEYLTGDSKAAAFARYIQGSTPLLMPTVVLYEVYKKLLMSEGKTSADRFASDALRRKVAPLDDDLAIAAAEVSGSAGWQWRMPSFTRRRRLTTRNSSPETSPSVACPA